jgi:hypothetical protein
MAAGKGVLTCSEYDHVDADDEVLAVPRIHGLAAILQQACDGTT